METGDVCKLKPSTQFVVVNFPEGYDPKLKPEVCVLECDSMRQVDKTIRSYGRDRSLIMTREEFIPRWEEFARWSVFMKYVSPES